ncbi:NAD(P)/FAD-dependent oxidoreductase [Gordonia hankookensis]|uniref:FAD-dependent oxidoreductase n=1 Tax=Gordonia hankookensis TaxID=589403 RepID=A0ABR7W9K2_9ACTN|nr:FAD-dependent oxidoreductase [Gordonia hankookensis]MBD1318497.1 FAD-dependent oxidoreductase [Gordonia hankookensis]
MRRRVVVVGGGYAGTHIARSLDDDAEVTLIDPRDAFVNVAASLRALTQPDWAHRPFFDYRCLLTQGRVVQGTVASADPGGVFLSDGSRVDADHLVLATGSSHPYPAAPRHMTASTEQAVEDLRVTNAELARSGRVLILGAGPVGLELAGEIHDVWPDKRITVVDPSADVLPGFLPDVRADLRRQLDRMGVEMRLDTRLAALPSVEMGAEATFTVTTDAGESITADIWFRCYGARVNTGYLDDGALVPLTDRHTVPVDEHLNVVGYENVYAVGDIADLTDAKMATHAQTQALVVVDNIRAQLHGEPTLSAYQPALLPRILLPLGTRGGVGQLPGPEGDAMRASLTDVIERKGFDLFTARFAERFRVRAVGGDI